MEDSVDIKEETAVAPADHLSHETKPGESLLLSYDKLFRENSPPYDEDAMEIDSTEAEDETSIARRKAQEEQDMECSVFGKAWTLVESSIRLAEETNDIETIALDDMFFLVERLYRAQQDFKRQNIPCKVDIAYHHTRSENLTTIRTDGLLSVQERSMQNITSKFNGSAYGDGIYCASNPFLFANERYGDTTILLACMKGVESINHKKIPYRTRLARDHFCVLQKSNQCVPLFHFPSKLLAKGRSDDLPSSTEKVPFPKRLANFHKTVQHTLLDKWFNDNIHTTFDHPKAFPCNTSNQLRRFRRQRPQQPFARLPGPRPNRNRVLTGDMLKVSYVENCNSVEDLEIIIKFSRTKKTRLQLLTSAEKRLKIIRYNASLNEKWPAINCTKSTCTSSTSKKPPPMAPSSSTVDAPASEISKKLLPSRESPNVAVANCVPDCDSSIQEDFDLISFYICQALL